MITYGSIVPLIGGESLGIQESLNGQQPEWVLSYKDFEANDERGIGAPTIVFYPLTQTRTLQDSVKIGSYIVFKEDSIKAFSGVHLQIHFPNDLLDFDTILLFFMIRVVSTSTLIS